MCNKSLALINHFLCDISWSVNRGFISFGQARVFPAFCRVSYSLHLSLRIDGVLYIDFQLYPIYSREVRFLIIYACHACRLPVSRIDNTLHNRLIQRVKPAQPAVLTEYLPCTANTNFLTGNSYILYPPRNQCWCHGLHTVLNSSEQGLQWSVFSGRARHCMTLSKELRDRYTDTPKCRKESNASDCVTDRHE